MLRVILLIAVVGLGACAPVEWPKSTGSGMDDLPASPCACGEPFYRNGQWLS
jgi:hypothetical protein